MTTRPAQASLIPDGANLEALRLEFVDAGERASRLAQLAGVQTDYPAYNARALVGDHIRRTLLGDLR